MRLNKIKQSFLATAIALSLATGTSYAADIAADALPTGGVAVEGMGTITGLNNVAGGITLDGGAGIIDWSTFNIGEGATLTFDLNGNALLNRVGADGGVSYLLGTLTSENGTLILSNPNGIVVGGGATFNANDLMLSTMSISNDQFKALLNGEEITLTDKNNSLIDIKTKANFNVKELLQIFGGSVTIADDVVITDGAKDTTVGNPHNIAVAALEGLNVTKNPGTYYNGTVTNPYNKLDIGKVTLGGNDTRSLNLFGGDIQLHGTKLTNHSDVDIHGENVTMKDTIVSAGDEIKVEGWGESINISGGELQAINDVQIKGHSPGIKVNIENATLTAKDDVEIHAGERVGHSGAEGITATYANAINIKDSYIKADNDVAIRGGAVNIDKSILLAKDAVEINAFYEGSEPAEGMKFDAGSKNIVNINGSTLATNENAVTILGGVVNITGGKMDTKELNVAALRHLESVDKEPNMEKITVSDKSVVTIGSDVNVVDVELTVVDKSYISNVVADYNPEPSVGPAPVIPTDEDVKKVLEEKPPVESFEKYVEAQSQSMESATIIVNTIVKSKDLTNEEKAAYVGAVVKGNAALSEVSNGANDKVNSESSNNDSAAAATEASTTPASSTESEEEDVTIN